MMKTFLTTEQIIADRAPDFVVLPDFRGGDAFVDRREAVKPADASRETLEGTYSTRRSSSHVFIKPRHPITDGSTFRDSRKVLPDDSIAQITQQKLICPVRTMTVSRAAAQRRKDRQRSIGFPSMYE